jgi:hypothetical protein
MYRDTPGSNNCRYSSALSGIKITEKGVDCQATIFARLATAYMLLNLLPKALKLCLFCGGRAARSEISQ